MDIEGFELKEADKTIHCSECGEDVPMSDTIDETSENGLQVDVKCPHCSNVLFTMYWDAEAKMWC